MLEDIFNIKFKIQVKETKLFIDKTKEQNVLISILRGFQEDTISIKEELYFKNNNQKMIKNFLQDKNVIDEI